MTDLVLLTGLLLPGQGGDLRLTQAGAVEYALRHLLKQPPEVRPYLRYVYVSRPDRQIRAAWKLHYNLLSRSRHIRDVMVVRRDLWCIDLRLTGLDPGVWEAGADIDIHFHVREVARQDLLVKRVWPGGKDKRGKFFRRQYFTQRVSKGDVVTLAAPWLPREHIISLRHLTYSEAPILEARQLLSYSRNQVNPRNDAKSGFGYYDFFGIRNRDDYFKVGEFSIARAERLGFHERALKDRSGVSPQNRIIVAYRGPTGWVFVTLDTKSQLKRGVFLRTLDPRDVDHDAEEIYLPLPNGLPLTGAFDNRGNLQAVAPGDSHGFSNRTPLNESNDGRIHVNGACFDCHAGDVLKPFKDDIREMFRAGLNLGLASTSHKQFIQLSDLWLSKTWEENLDKQRAEYQLAVRRATVTEDYPEGLEAAAAARVYARTHYSYLVDPVTLNRAAQELAVTPQTLLNALKLKARPPTTGKPSILDTPLARFLARDPLPLSRLTWEDSFHLAQSYLASYYASGGR